MPLPSNVRNRKRPPYEGKRTRAIRIAELEQEVAELRAQLSVAPSQTPHTWAEFLTQEMRDEFAARALARAWGDTHSALARLNFVNIPNVRSAEHKELANMVFDTPGVRERLAISFKDADASWNEIMERQRQIALRGDDDASVRAATQLAKIEGRIRQPDASALTQSISLAVLVNGQQATPMTNVTSDTPQSLDILTVLAHEPGEPKRVDMDDEGMYEALER